MSVPLCEFHSSQVMRNKNKNLDDNTHIGRLIIIYNYPNALSIAHSVFGGYCIYKQRRQVCRPTLHCLSITKRLNT